MSEVAEKRFPILYAFARDAAEAKRIKSVPWEWVEPHRKQIEHNHSQTLERLAERGGLSWLELAIAAMGHDPWKHF